MPTTYSILSDTTGEIAHRPEMVSENRSRSGSRQTRLADKSAPSNETIQHLPVSRWSNAEQTAARQQALQALLSGPSARKFTLSMDSDHAGTIRCSLPDRAACMTILISSGRGDITVPQIQCGNLSLPSMQTSITVVSSTGTAHIVGRRRWPDT